MNETRVTLGSEIRRLRGLADTTLRQFAQCVGISAPHLSDIERDRRRPSKGLLQRIARELQGVGATYESLDRHDTRFERDLQEWVSETPEVRRLLRTVKESGQPVSEVLKELERLLKSGKRE